MNRNSFLKLSVETFLIRVLGALAGFLMSIVVTRSLSIEQSGLFFLAHALCSGIGMLCTLGLPDALVRFIAGFHSQENWSEIKGVFNKSVSLVLLMSSIVSIALYYFSYFICSVIFSKPDFEYCFELIVIAIPFFSIYQLFSYAFLGLNKPSTSIFFQSISCPMLVVISLVIFSKFSLDASAALVACIFLFSAFVTTAIAASKWFSSESLKVIADHSQTSDLVLSAKSLFFVMLMGMVLQYSGQIICGLYLDAYEVAHFSVAQRVSLLASFVLIVINYVAAPRFAACAKLGKKEELQKTALFCSRIMVLVATPVVIFIFFFADFLMGFFGAEYVHAASLLKILIVGQFVNVITGSVSYLLNMTGNEKDMRNIVFLSGPLALALCFILIPIYGSTGAAIAIATAVASQNLLAVYFVKKRLGFNTLRFF
jgi:O-antigen/teichoic acid export membrane protein